MRDRRDYLIAGLAAALVFAVGVVVGQGTTDGSLLPAASAQDAVNGGAIDPTPGGGVTINPTREMRPGFGGRGSAPTASDSNSNNRFVAVTSPIGSGESALFVLDSKSEQLAVYRFDRRKGLSFLAGRKIDFDLKISGYNDQSKYSRNEMMRQFEKDRARAAAEALKAGKKKK